MKPIIDMTQIRIQTLVDLEERWGKAPARQEALKGMSDLVPLHGYIREEHMGDLELSSVQMVKDNRLVKFKEEDSLWHGPGSVVFNMDAALDRLTEVLGYRPPTAQIVNCKFRSKKQTSGGYPYQQLDFRFVCVSESDYEEIRRRCPSILVTLRGYYVSAIERDMDLTFEDERECA